MAAPKRGELSKKLYSVAEVLSGIAHKPVWDITYFQSANITFKDNKCLVYKKGVSEEGHHCYGVDYWYKDDLVARSSYFTKDGVTTLEYVFFEIIDNVGPHDYGRHVAKRNSKALEAYFEPICITYNEGKM